MFRSMLSTLGRVLVILLVAGVVVGAAYAFSPSTASAAQFGHQGNQALGNVLPMSAVHAVSFSVRGFDGGDGAGRGGTLAGVFTVAKDILILGAIITGVWLFRKVKQPQAGSVASK